MSALQWRSREEIGVIKGVPWPLVGNGHSNQGEHLKKLATDQRSVAIAALAGGGGGIY